MDYVRVPVATTEYIFQVILIWRYCLVSPTGISLIAIGNSSPYQRPTISRVIAPILPFLYLLLKTKICFQVVATPQQRKLTELFSHSLIFLRNSRDGAIL
jgi:hypothetical protein